MTAITINRKSFLTQFLYTVLTISGMVFLSIFIHLIPFSGEYPLGAYLLPMFIAPLVAAFFVSPIGLFLSTIIAPIINNILTGMPKIPLMYFLICELILFAILSSWAIKSRKTFAGFSAVAFLIAKVVVMIPQIIILNDNITLPVIGRNLASLEITLPGILVLIAVERFLIRLQSQ